jgi:hypothetical protein
MAAITLEYFKVVEKWEEITVKSGEDIASRAGKYLRVDASTGKAMLGNASSAGEVGTLRGIAETNQRYVGDSVTLLRRGLIDVGDGLDDLDYGEAVYLTDTDGVLGDVASIGTVTTAIVGYVWPNFEADGTANKLLYINVTDVLGV